MQSSSISRRPLFYVFEKLHVGGIDIRTFQFFLFLVWLPLFSEDCFADGKQIEGIQVNAIVLGMRLYKDVNGRLPKTWEELSKLCNLDDQNRLMTKVYGYRLQDRYQFVSKPYPIFKHGDDFDIDERSQVLLIRVIPFTDYPSDGRVFRTVVYQDSTGEISWIELNEEKAQKLFKMFGISIAVPHGLPPVETLVNRVHQAPPSAPPDPTDAKRVWPPGSRQPKAGVATTDTSPTITTAANDTHATATHLFTWLGLAAAALCSVILLLARFWKKDGNSQR